MGSTLLRWLPCCCAVTWLVAVGLYSKPAAADPPRFPNLFLPKAYRHLDPKDLPPAVVGAALRDLNAALGGLFRNLEVPVAVTEGGRTVVKRVKYFAHVDQQFARLEGTEHPTTELDPSGGVVRAGVAKLYWAIHDAEARGGTREAVLREFATSNQPVPLHDAQGMGSDFDLQLKAQPQLWEAARNATYEGLARLRPDIDPSALGSHIDRTLFTFIDVGSQTDRFDAEKLVERSQFDAAAEQGGSTADMFRYSRRQGKLVSPDRFPQLAEDLIRGWTNYADPAPGQPAASQKQKIRGIRTLLEWPWTRFKTTADDERFRHDVISLREAVERGEPLDPKALLCAEKGWRNAAPEGAGNRVYRSEAGTTDHEILLLSNAVQQKQHVPIVPEFLPSLPVGRPVLGMPAGPPAPPGEPSLDERLGQEISHHLISRAVFDEKYTNGGWLYHGTHTVSGALAILKGNILLSREGQGTAVKGRGAYFTKDESVAAGRVGNEGLVLNLRVKPGPLRVLNWETFSQTEAGKKLLEQAGHLDRAFEILTNRYGIDIVLNEHVVVQNAGVLEYPPGRERFKFLVDSYAARIRNSTMSPMARLQAYETHQRLLKYAHDVGLPAPDNTLPTSLFEEMASVARTHPSLAYRKEASEALVRIARDIEPKLAERGLLQAHRAAMDLALTDASEVTRIAGAEMVERLDRGLLPEIAMARSVPLLRAPDLAVRQKGSKILVGLVPREPAAALLVLARPGLFESAVRHADEPTKKLWKEKLRQAWRAEDWPRLARYLDGQSVAGARLWLETVTEHHSYLPRSVKSLDPVTRARVAGLLFEKARASTERSGGAHMPDTYPRRYDAALHDNLALLLGGNDETERLEEAIKLKPLGEAQGLLPSELRDLAARLALRPRDLLRLDPAFGATTIHFLIKDTMAPALLRPQEHEAQLRRALAETPGLGSAEEWLAVSRELSRKLRRQLERGTDRDAFGRLYDALFSLPTTPASVLQEILLDDPAKYSAERAHGLIHGLYAIPAGQLSPDAVRIVGAFARHSDVRLRQSALRLLFGWHADLSPVLRRLLVAEIGRFPSGDFHDILEQGMRHLTSHGDPRSPLRILQRELPGVFERVLEEVMHKDPRSVPSHLVEDYLRAPGGDQLPKLRLLASLIESSLEKGEFPTELLNRARELAISLHDDPRLATEGKRLAEPLQEFLGDVTRKHGQTAREVFGATLFFMGTESSPYPTLARNQAEHSRDPAEKARGLVLIGAVRPHLEGEVRGRIEDLRDRERVDSPAYSAIDGLLRCKFGELLPKEPSPAK